MSITAKIKGFKHKYINLKFKKRPKKLNTAINSYFDRIDCF
jgi:hypothetical protein